MSELKQAQEREKDRQYIAELLEKRRQLEEQVKRLEQELRELRMPEQLAAPLSDEMRMELKTIRDSQQSARRCP